MQRHRLALRLQLLQGVGGIRAGFSAPAPSRANRNSAARSAGARDVQMGTAVSLRFEKRWGLVGQCGANLHRQRNMFDCPLHALRVGQAACYGFAWPR